ncbi:hypothetical protein Leryth_024633 [Lithospermum erythrorhizon]|nr:hypothetical protein Leryth_024633 [Lithospermum erythrorhizon]
MGRYRSRSRSYSPVRRSKHYDEPRDHRASPARSGLLVRNLPLNARNEDLRVPFERYGPLKDVYMPKNYYSGEPRGFGFVKFRYAEDAATAKERLDHTVIGGREIRIVYAEENRKTPQEMRRVTGTSSRSSRRKRSPSRSPRRRDHSYSRSPSPVRRAPSPHNWFFLEVWRICRGHGGRDAHASSRRYRSVSRSASPKDDKRYRSAERSSRRSRSISRSPPRSKKGDETRHRYSSPRRSRSISRSPPCSKNGHDPRDEDDMPDQSPIPQRNSYSRSRSRSITKSPR